MVYVDLYDVNVAGVDGVLDWEQAVFRGVVAPDVAVGNDGVLVVRVEYIVEIVYFCCFLGAILVGNKRDMMALLFIIGYI